MVTAVPPRVSIITPTFEAGATIEACLRSVIDQVYPSFEHIIVDGRSQDNTLNTLDAYAKKYGHIKYISEADQGVYDAMNKGVAMASGDWMYFLGSDDMLYHKDVLSDVFIKNDVDGQDAVYGDVYSLRFNGLYDGSFDYEKILKKNICHQAIFFRKNLFQKTGLFNTKFETSADYDHNLKWFLNRDYKKKYIPVCVARYADGGLSSTQEDLPFQNKKPCLALRYEKGTLGRQWRIDFSKKHLIKSVRAKKIGHSLHYLYYYLLSKIGQ